MRAIIEAGKIEHEAGCAPSPSLAVEPESDKVSAEVLAEVREYTDLPIMVVSSGFPSNNLFAVRGKHCEFTELTKSVAVYVYPAPSPTVIEGQHTEWKLNADEGWIYEFPTPENGGDVICLAPDMDASLERWKENAKTICDAPRLKRENERLNEQFQKTAKKCAEHCATIELAKRENEEMREVLESRGKQLREYMETLKMLSDAAKGSDISNWPQQKYAIELLNRK